MKEIINIINQLQNTSGTNDKLAILKNNKDDEIIKKVLYYTYNPYMKYGISEKILKPNKTATFVTDIFKLLDTLNESNINDSLRALANSFIGSFESEEQELYKMMLLKDLKIGLNAKSINKVWKDLIPQFNVMLAESYFKQKEGFLKGEFILTEKLDGIRCVAIKENDTVKFYSRQGQLIEGLVDIEEDLLKIPNGHVLDGELLLRNDNNLPSDELYRATMKVARKDGEKRNLIFNAFDIIDTQDFKNGFSAIHCSNRKGVLSCILEELNSKYVVEVPILYQGLDQSKIIELLDKAKSENKEGIMLNLSNAPYECKRSKGILKVKVMQTADVRCVDVIEGTGKNVGKLGAITIEFEHEGEIHRCNCGSGFKDEERVLYYNNPELILNKIVEVSYFEVSKNEQGGIGLRFPVWKSRIRDKSEISMN